MAIAVRGTPQVGSNTNGNDVTLTFSTGAGAPLQGDVVVVFGGHGATVTTLAAPGSGYTQLGIHTGTAPICGAWYKVMGVTPDLSVVCSGGGNASDGVAYCCWVFSGVHTDILDQTTVTAGPTTSTNPDAASITTQTANAWVLPMASSAVNDAAITGPSGYSNHITANGNDAVDLTTAGATLAVVSPGATNPPNWTNWASGAWYAITIALKVAPNPPVNVAITGNAGTGAVGNLGRAIAKAITGNLITGSVGTVGTKISYSVALTGNSASGTVGNLGKAIAMALTGVSVTGSVGDLGKAISKALIGVLGTFSIGTLTPSSGAGGSTITFYRGVSRAPSFKGISKIILELTDAGGGTYTVTRISGVSDETPNIQSSETHLIDGDPV